MDAKALYAWQQALARSGLKRSTIDGKFLYYARTMFVWAAEPVRELVDEAVPSRLRLVRPLRYGRTPAREPERVLSVSRANVDAVCLYADERLYAMLMVHWFTGMRPDELCKMARSCIDTSSLPWIYEPFEHKSELTGKRRLIPIGPPGRSVLETRMAGSAQDYLFPNPPGRRAAGEPMNPNSYLESVKRIQSRYGVEHWTPAQIRHSFATRVQRGTGDREAAQILLDHSSALTTSHYLDPNEQRKAELAEEYG